MISIRERDIRPLTFQKRTIREAIVIDGELWFSGLSIIALIGVDDVLLASFTLESLQKEISIRIDKEFTTEVSIEKDSSECKSALFYRVPALLLFCFVMNSLPDYDLMSWVAHFVDAWRSGKIVSCMPVTEIAKIAKRRFDVLDDLPHGKKSEAIRKLAEDLGISRATLYRYVKSNGEVGTMELKK